MQWLIENWTALLSLISMALALGIGILQLSHKTAMVQSLQNLEDMIDKLKSPARSSTPVAESVPSQEQK